MAVITLQNIVKSFGAAPVLSGLSASFERGERVGLVGANGTGKSTVLRIIAGREKADSGTVHVARRLRLGYLPQEANFRSDRTLREALLAVFSELRAQADRLRDIEARLKEHGTNPGSWDPIVLQEYTDLLALFEEQGGYTYEQRVEQVASGLGFARELWDQPVTQLSGGQKTRARLARLLLEQPDFLLLDEPTNHLDLEMIEWLETFLGGWRGGLILVSHDRYFLDKITRRTSEVINGKIESYPASYSRYHYLRAERYRRQQKEYEAQQAHIAKTEDFIRRYGAGQRSKEARGRQKRLGRVERLDRGPQHGETLAGLRLDGSSRSGDAVLSTVHLRIGYPGKGLLALPNVHVRRNQRIALIGPNGSGKSTLLRTLGGEISPLGGSFAWGTNVIPGYCAQAPQDLQSNRTLLQEVQDARAMSEESARGYLGRFLFTGDDVFKDVSDLSGGERSRLALACLTLQKANLLLLDEPTNHLDIAARDALEGVLREYDGTLLFASHDRYFIDSLATTLWIVENGAIRVYEGTYAGYSEARAKGLLLQPMLDKLEMPANSASIQRQRRRKGETPPLVHESALPQAVWHEGVAQHVAVAHDLERIRQDLTVHLIRLQGQTLDGLLALADGHMQAQDALWEEDNQLLATVRRSLSE